MLLDKIREYNIILGSSSPRRKELLAALGISFTQASGFHSDENYDEAMPVGEIPVYLARKKSLGYPAELKEKDILITADTIVAQGEEVLHKPVSKDDAYSILRQLSGNTHRVYTGVCLRSSRHTSDFVSVTEVSFGQLTEAEIIYYIEHYKPYDKAGAYGIQEWIGFVAVERISGSYFNVMGLPIHCLYRELERFIQKSDRS